MALRQALLDTLKDHRQSLRQQSFFSVPYKESQSNNVTPADGYKDSGGSVGDRGRRDAPAVMYVPVGGGEGGIRCPDAVDAAAVSVSQLVFLSLSLGVFTAITNIANNINNNNNNNNDNNDNNINSNNLNVGANANVGNQITVELPIARSLRDIHRVWAPYSHAHAHQTHTHHAHNYQLPPTTLQNTPKYIFKPPTQPTTPSPTPSPSLRGVVAAWVLEGVKKWAWDVLPLSPPCLGLHICRLQREEQNDVWIHSLAG